MVRFEKESFIIEIKTGINPAEDYIGLFEGICDIITTGSPDEQNPNNFYYVINLLRAMMPEWETVKKMTI